MLLDRDEIIEQSDEEHADEYLLEAVESELAQGNKVIIDTQLPVHCNEETLRVLVYSPLAVLIERDKQRTQRLKRPEKRQYWARAFLFETFAGLYDLEKVKNEGSVDRVFMLPLKEEISPFLKIAPIAEFFGAHLQDEHPHYLYPKQAPNLIIRSHLQTISESVQIVFKLLYAEKS